MRSKAKRKTIPYYYRFVDEEYGNTYSLGHKTNRKGGYLQFFTKSVGYTGWDCDRSRFICERYHRGPLKPIRGTSRWDAYQKYFPSYARVMIRGLKNV